MQTEIQQTQNMSTYFCLNGFLFWGYPFVDHCSMSDAIPQHQSIKGNSMH